MSPEGGIAERIQDVLKELELNVPTIEASAVVSAVGLPIASALPTDIDETRVAAITASILTMSERAIMDFGKGQLNQIIIRGSKGLLISMAAGENAVLTVSASHDARLGIILLYMERAAKEILDLLENQ
ncbi:MAG: roadblock/LC7 domain-containing protein [Candidatus Helarchaeota archaeon]